MQRYAVKNRTSGATHALFDNLSEAIASAVKLQDEGKKVGIIDGQGSGAVMAGHFDVLEAEGYLGRTLHSEKITHPVLVEEILVAAKKDIPPKHVYHWDV